MNKLNCVTHVLSNSNHIQQLFCGLQGLANKNRITLKQIIETDNQQYKQNRLLPYENQSPGLRVELNAKIKIYFDMSDGHDVDGYQVDWCDFYFKRSFNSATHSAISSKIYALELNYLVKSSLFSFMDIQRAYYFSFSYLKIKNVLREIDVFNLYSHQTRVSEVSQGVDENQPFKVLFMCRLWDPTQNESSDLTDEQVKERYAINQMRVDCIRRLKIEFGDDFIGGVADSSYARKFSPDIIASTRLSKKSQYLKLVKQCSVCVATNGLSGSIGWKFGEYMGLSRAIISEKLHSETRAGLKKNINYLEFESPEDCVNAVLELKDDKRRRAMQRSNHHYYKEFLTPEQVIQKSLEFALSNF